MDYYIFDKIGRTLVVKLEEGDMALESIASVCKEAGIKNAVIESGIGTFDQAYIHRITSLDNPPSMISETIEETPLELASLSGIVANGDLHIHCVFGAPGKQTWAGHLEPKCRTIFFGEIVIQELLGNDLIRRRCEKGALHLYPKEI